MDRAAPLGDRDGEQAPAGDTAAAVAGDPFGPATVEAIVRHMNADHVEDSLLIARWLGGIPDATAAELVSIGSDGAEFSVSTPRGAVLLALPWSAPVVERRDVREQIVRMLDRALALGGLPARRPAEH